MGLKAGWLALFVFVWIIGAFLGSTYEYQDSTSGEGIAYSTGTATFTYNDRTVTGVGTTWNNTTMAGGLIKNNADGKWYKISSVTNATELELTAVYASATSGGVAYTMATSPGWAGTGTGGYDESPVNTMEYLTNISNAFQRISLLGNVPLPIPNPEYFKTAFKVITWQWSFMEGYEMFYWIFLCPFVIMGVLSMILLVYGIISGNVSM